ncbi:5-formyltetrahydrofolate cyclo-ligase [Streptomyces sp. 21So2-11]|uniref:5-formyltetrahydrofolate cyclo-ligase n=1 Tax=Streptomyces sp. 21So2-11 TaxID=3144408 RepID=UPI0032192D99
MTHTPDRQAKQVVRTQIWDALDAAGAVHDTTSHGRIPNFHGREAAADRLAILPAWQRSRIIKSVPDKAQYPVRVRALTEHKTVYMAVPKLAAERPFYLLDPVALSVPPAEAAYSRTAAMHAPTVEVDALAPIDVIVLGSVAVNPTGVRIGKGAGYSDIEFALLAEAGLITPDTLIVTTVHSLQVTETPIPHGAHDVNVDLIVTPDEIIICTHPHRPSGILWDRLPAAKVEAIPSLRARASGGLCAKGGVTPRESGRRSPRHTP